MDVQLNAISRHMDHDEDIRKHSLQLTYQSVIHDPLIINEKGRSQNL